MINSSVVSDFTSVNLTYNLTNLNGIVHAGIINSSVTNASGSFAKPNFTQLVGGFDGNNTAMFAKSYVMLNMGQTGTISFTNLTNTTNYTVYFGASSLDIGRDALVSDVYYQFVSTPAPSTFANVIKVSLLLLGVLVLGLFGMI